VRVTVSENGKRRTLNVCPQDYARLRAQNASPFESLFGGSLFGDDFMSDLLDNGAPAPGGGAMRPRQEQDRQSTDVGDFLSEQAEEILQQAARAASEWGSREVDSEHLLYALADNDVVQAILGASSSSPKIIVFHALDRKQIREIVGLQLERVRRMAKAQGMELEFEDSLIDHLAEVGYQPEYGARELKRQVRSLLETKLADAMLKSEITEGDKVRFSYDRNADEVRWEKRAPAAPSKAPSKGDGDGARAGQARP